MEYCNCNYCYSKRVTDGHSGLEVGLLGSLVSRMADSNVKQVSLTVNL